MVFRSDRNQSTDPKGLRQFYQSKFTIASIPVCSVFGFRYFLRHIFVFRALRDKRTGRLNGSSAPSATSAPAGSTAAPRRFRDKRSGRLNGSSAPLPRPGRPGSPARPNDPCAAKGTRRSQMSPAKGTRRSGTTSVLKKNSENTKELESACHPRANSNSFTAEAL